MAKWVSVLGKAVSRTVDQDEKQPPPHPGFALAGMRRPILSGIGTGVKGMDER